MTLASCTEMLRQHDPDRFGAVLAAAPGDRGALVTLYALNLEIARAPFQSAEPMLAEMRLQWWVDRLADMGEGTAPPLHDVLTPLWQDWGIAAGTMAQLAEARRRDCARTPLADVDAVLDYIDQTAGLLMQIAAGHLGTSQVAIAAAQGRAAGLGAWLRALPQLQALNLGLRAPDPEAIAALGAEGLAALDQARLGRRLPPKRAAPALYPGPRLRPLLRRAARDPSIFLGQPPVITPFQRRASLAGLALTGRWWR